DPRSPPDYTAGERLRVIRAQRPAPGALAAWHGGVVAPTRAVQRVAYARAVHDAWRLGVDLGGTKTEAVVARLQGADFEVIARRRIATERDAGYAHIVARTAGLIADVTRDAGLSAPPPIGVGMPGSISTTTGVALVKNSNTTCLNGMPFR